MAKSVKRHQPLRAGNWVNSMRGYSTALCGDAPGIQDMPSLRSGRQRLPR
jgi:hypothetical protein